MGIVFIWRPGAGGPLWSHVFGRDTPFGTGGCGLGADLKKELSDWNTSHSEDKLPAGPSEQTNPPSPRDIDIAQSQ